jgi:hypothetical protein
MSPLFARRLIFEPLGKIRRDLRIEIRNKQMNNYNQISRYISITVLCLLYSNICAQNLTPSQRYEREKEEREKARQQEIERLTTISDDFPSNYVVDEWWPSCFKGQYVFNADSTFIYIHGCNGESEDYEIGYWYKTGDSIIIKTNMAFGTRPIGEPENPEAYGAAAPEDYLIYGTYVNYEKWITKTIKIDINNFLYEMCLINDELNASDISVNKDYYMLDGNFKVASCRTLTEEDLLGLSKEELRLMRNEIFARYGYRFKSDDLRTHFTKMKWYKPSLDNADDYLTEIEKKNIKLILDFERE